LTAIFTPRLLLTFPIRVPNFVEIGQWMRTRYMKKYLRFSLYLGYQRGNSRENPYLACYPILRQSVQVSFRSAINSEQITLRQKDPFSSLSFPIRGICSSLHNRTTAYIPLLILSFVEIGQLIRALYMGNKSCFWLHLGY
jgi:hypothetical protein